MAQGRSQSETLGPKVGISSTGTPKVCNIMALWAVFRGFGHTYGVAGRLRAGMSTQKVSEVGSGTSCLREAYPGPFGISKLWSPEGPEFLGPLAR